MLPWKASMYPCMYMCTHAYVCLYYVYLCKHMWYMYLYTYIHAYIPMHVYLIHVYIHICMHIQTHLCLSTYMPKCIHSYSMHTYTCIHVCLTCMHALIHTDRQTHVSLSIYVYKCACIPLCMSGYLHTNIHICLNTYTSICIEHMYIIALIYINVHAYRFMLVCTYVTQHIYVHSLHALYGAIAHMVVSNYCLWVILVLVNVLVFCTNFTLWSNILIFLSLIISPHLIEWTLCSWVRLSLIYYENCSLP